MSSAARAWTVYTIVRLLAFAVPFALVMLSLPGWQWGWAVALAAGALVSGLVSYIFLKPQRAEMASAWAARSAEGDRRSEDELAEDEAVDAAGESSLERAEAGVADDEGVEFEEEAAPAAHEVEDVDGGPDPEDVDASVTSSMEQAPADEDTPHDPHGIDPR